MMTDPSMTPPPGVKTARSRTALTHGTWVLVADGQKALLLENVGDADLPLLELRHSDEQDNPPTSRQGTDRPGRPSDGPGGRRSALQDTDWHQLAEDHFAHDLAGMLLRHADRCDRLIVAAAPKVLGALRKAMPAELSRRIVAEVATDLTNHPVDAIAAQIKARTTPD